MSEDLCYISDFLNTLKYLKALRLASWLAWAPSLHGLHSARVLVRQLINSRVGLCA